MLPLLLPPSYVILSVYKKYNAIPSDIVIQETSENVLLQQKNKDKRHKCEEKTEDVNQDICAFCGKEEPPEREKNCTFTDVLWVACDGCLSWFRVECCGLEECKDISALKWLCFICKQSCSELADLLLY